ncbi:MAG: DNA photolyase family protein [Neomegalonema sp.]|nr:DNA photolyase family protein [Neomegalonema sp.]
MPKSAGTIVWLRRDLRLSDHPAFRAALEREGPVWPVFILDAQTEALGAAPKWRLGEGLRVFTQTLEAQGSRLILRRGDPLTVLRALIEQTGADAVTWSRLYDPASIERDKAVKAGLKEDGISAQSCPGHLLFEPFEPKTQADEFFKVYTPFWKAVRKLPPPPEPLPSIRALHPPQEWPDSDRLDDWKMGKAMRRGAAVVADFACIGEKAAQDRLDTFIDERLTAYKDERDRPDLPATSRLSENLTYGEISPRVIWHAAEAAIAGDPKAERGGEHFLKELVWREFAWHLLYHTPQIESENWRSEWDAFPWREESEAVQRWRMGRTGEPFVDAAMRELYVTGTMHNRCRMLVGSYLTKNLLSDWRLGLKWFEECLIDWDPASNAMGWQWIAGSGPDAAPYFRIYNPRTQIDKFDPQGDYIARWLPEYARSDLTRTPHEDGLRFFEACPRSWDLSEKDTYPDPLVDLKASRERALEAYGAVTEQKSKAEEDAS